METNSSLKHKQNHSEQPAVMKESAVKRTWSKAQARPSSKQQQPHQQQSEPADVAEVVEHQQQAVPEKAPAKREATAVSRQVNLQDAQAAAAAVDAQSASDVVVEGAQSAVDAVPMFAEDHKQMPPMPEKSEVKKKAKEAGSNSNGCNNEEQHQAWPSSMITSFPLPCTPHSYFPLFITNPLLPIPLASILSSYVCSIFCMLVVINSSVTKLTEL